MINRTFFLVLTLLSATIVPAVSLEGVVVDSAQNPLSNATVRLIPDRPRYLTEQEMEPFATATTGADGQFRIIAPDNEACAILASAPGFRIAKFPVNVQAAASRKIGVRLEPGLAIQGRVLSEGGDPIANAKLGPLAPTIEVEPTAAAKVLPQWVQSDAEGKFAFAPTHLGVELQFVAQAAGHETATIQVAAGEPNIEFQLRRGGHKLSGSVYSTGRPASEYANAYVKASGDQLEVTTVANDKSEFQFEGLPPGQFSLSAIFLQPRASRSPQVELPRDESTSIGIQVTSGYYVRGRAMDVETSTPAVGVGIRIRDSITTSTSGGFFAAGPFYEPFQVIPEVVDGGSYAIADPEAALDLPMSDGFADVADLEVQVRAKRLIKVSVANAENTTIPITLNLLSTERRPYRTQTSAARAELKVYHAGDYLLYASAGNMVSEAKPLTITRGDQSVALTLGPAAGIAGKVIIPGEELTTRSMSFTVKILTSDSDTSAILLSEAHPTATGAFHFPTLPAGSFVAKAVNQSATRQQKVPVNLRPGETVPLDFIIERGNTFAGIVQDQNATPIPSVQITFGYKDGGFSQVAADDQGRFRAEDLLTSTVVNVQIEHYGFASYRHDSVDLPREDFLITLQRQGVLQVRVDAPPATRWKVMLLESRPWATGGYAEQLMSNPVNQASVDGQEMAEFPLPQFDRMRLVGISDTKQIAVSRPFSSADFTNAENEMVLTPSQQGRIFGSIGTGNVAADITAWNTALPEGSVESEFKITTENGNYEIGGLPPGDYLVVAAGESVNASVLNVDLGPGEEKRVDLQGQPPATIQGRVVLAGEGVGRVQVELLSESNPSFQQRTTTTDAQGNFVFQDILPDSYLVRVTHRTSEGELKAQRTAKVTRESAPPAVLLDVTPVRPVLIQVPPGVGLSPGNEVNLVHSETREIIRARWVEGSLEAPAPPGKYEIWNGDAVAGQAEIDANGSGRILPATP